MEKTMNNLRCCIMLLLVMASVLMGVCQVPKTGFSAQATSLNFYFNDDPSVYAYSGQTRTVSATVQLSILVDGTFIPGVHAHPSWTVSISGPDPNNPQQTTTVGSAIFTHPGPYTNANVSVTLPAAAGAYTYTASLTGGEGTATSASENASIVKVSSLVPNEGTEFDDGDNDPDTKSYVVPIAATGTVTVTATPYASVAEDELPSEWSFTGGTAVGLGEFQRTVSKTTPGLTTLICSCGDSSKTVNLYVVAVDVQYGALTETTEDTPGAFIGVNDNDDNANGIADVNEQLDTNGNVTVTNEADLVPVSLFIADHPAAGTVTLSGGAAIKVWTNSTKGTPISLPASWTFTPTSDTMPTIVYVEGITPSSSVRDTSLVLTYSYGAVSVSDSLTITVVKTAIGGPGAEGIIAIVNRDDDNDNDTADVNDTGSVTGENELVPITLNLYPANLDAGSLSLTLPSNLKGWNSSTKGTATALSWTIPFGGGAFTPITVYLEGIAASRAVRDGEVKLAYSNSGKVAHTSKARSTVADLTVSLTDNVILTNTDDDDTNSASDLGQTGPITSENDLKQLRITLEPAGFTGTFTASARTIQFGDPDENGYRPITGYGTKQVNFFMDAAKGIVPPSGMSWTLNGTTLAPDALWLEGASVSAIADDQELTVQLAVGGYTLSAVTTATVNAHPGSSEVTFKLYEQSPIGQDKEVLNNEISGAVGGMVYVVMEVKLGAGEKLASSSATVRIKDTWSGYENGLSRGWMDIPVDFSSSEWCEMVNQSNGGCDLTWTTAAPAGTDNANGAMYRTFYAVIKEWNTPVEPYAEYYKQATDSWVHFDNPTVGHNGSHEISVVAVDEDTAQTALEFQHYDATAQPPGWQDPVEVNVAKRSVTISNLVVTNLSPGNGTIDYIKYDPDPDGKYHRPTMKATFNDNNPSGQQHYYVSYWMLLATANPVPREHLNMNDVYSRSDAVINTYATPTSVDFTWYGTRGEVNTDDILNNEECDVADWGTYTYDVDVIEYDENHEMVDWHSYKWPSCLSIGEHTISATDNEDESGSTLSYTYVLHDIANEDTTGYYPNAKAPTGVKMVVIDSDLEEQNTIDLNMELDGETRGGVAYSSSAEYSSLNFYRTLYVGSDNCWIADRREHLSSHMLASNLVNKDIYAAIHITKVSVDGNNIRINRNVIPKLAHAINSSNDSYLIVIHGFGDPRYSSFSDLCEHFAQSHNGRKAYGELGQIIAPPEYYKTHYRGGVYFLTYSTCNKRIDPDSMDVAEAIAARLNVFTNDNGERKKIDVICHSQGGMITQMAILLNGADSYVRNFITLGSPLAGLPINPNSETDINWLTAVMAVKKAGPIETACFFASDPSFTLLQNATNTNKTSFFNLGGSDPEGYFTQDVPGMKQWLDNKYGGENKYDGLIGSVTATANRNVTDQIIGVIGKNHDTIKEDNDVFNFLDNFLKQRGQN